MALHALDSRYLALTVLVTIAYQLLGFFIAYTLQFDKITDFTGGSNFFILALLTLLLGRAYFTRNIIATVFVCIWASRLAGFLLFRVLKRGSDSRFDDIRKHFFKFAGFWFGQILWVWTVSLPLTIVNSPDGSLYSERVPFGKGTDIAGIILWIVGWLVESVADAQKYRWKSTNTSKDEPIRIGVWAWSRHPPYFGEILCWWGIWMLCLTHTPASYGAIVSPLFTTILLLFGSGLPTAAAPTARRFLKQSPEAWANHERWTAEVSILIPIPPVIYRYIPMVVKRTLLFDWPMYRLNEKEIKDGKHDWNLENNSV